MTTTYEFHKFSQWPRMHTAEESAEMLSDMRLNGYRGAPALLYQGKILDGRNRYLICKELGIELPVESFAGNDIEALMEAKRRENHRDSTQTQKAAAQRAWEDLCSEVRSVTQQIADEAAQRMLDGQRSGGRGKKKNSTPPAGESFHDEERHDRETSTKRAELAGVGRTTMAAVDAVFDAGEVAADLREAMRTGELSAKQAVKKLKERANGKPTAALESADAKNKDKSKPAKKGSFNSKINGQLEQWLSNHYARKSRDQLTRILISNSVASAVDNISGELSRLHRRVERLIEMDATEFDQELSNALATLSVGPDATRDEIKRAYKEKSKTAHPDKGGSQEEMQKLNAAFHVAKERTYGIK